LIFPSCEESPESQGSAHARRGGGYPAKHGKEQVTLACLLIVDDMTRTAMPEEMITDPVSGPRIRGGPAKCDMAAT
jgi:hypothetical protein